MEITPVFRRIDERNASDVFGRAQIVIDGLDNLATRLAVNSACVRQKKPFIYGGVSRLRGRVTTIISGKTPCLGLFEIPKEEGETGVLGVTPAIIENLQALEAIKLIIGRNASLAGKLLMFNGDDMQFNYFDIERNPGCSVCSSIA